MQSKSFTKLFASITDSSIWSEDNATRIVWITMLAMADAHGYVGASILGLAARARVSVPECEKALAKFMAPDPYSRTRDHDGRRIVLDDGGWTLINYKRHRDIARDESVKESKRLWAARARSRQSADVDESRTSILPVELESNSPSASTSGSDLDLDPTRAREAGVFEAPTLTVDAKRARVAPADFEPTDAHRVRCQELGFAIEALLREFKLFEFNRDYSDWDRRFSRWIEDHRVRVETDRGKVNPGAGKAPQSAFYRSPTNPSAWSPNERHEALAQKLKLAPSDLQRLAAAYVRAGAVAERSVKDADTDFAKRLVNYSHGKPFGYGVGVAA
jgi:hypothetical protein